MRPFMPLIMPLTAHSAARFCVGVSALTLLGISPVAAAAQSLQAVGTISGGNAVALETRTVKRTTNEVTATLRTTFLEPAKAPGGAWYGSRTKVAVRCVEGTVAVLENRYYGDEKFTKIANERIVKIPGYAAPVPGSVPALALKQLCPAK
jgi:hypothetical protein